MAWSPLDGLDPALVQRATRIRLACFDVDGTLTDGRLYYDEEGREWKTFHSIDGQGLALLRRFGFAIAFITARASPATEKRGAELGVETYVQEKDKLARVHLLCERLGIGLDQVAFLGDDLADLAPLQKVGLAVAPGNAHPWVLEHVHWQTRARGGEGAARELCDVLLAAQGHVPALLEAAGASGSSAARADVGASAGT